MSEKFLPLDKRAYGPDSSDADRAAIESWVQEADDGVITWREVPVISPFSLKTQFARIRSLKRSPLFMVIDLTHTQGPDAECRDVLRDEFGTIVDDLTHASVFVGDNEALATQANFVMGRLGLKSYTVNKTMEEALEAINERRKAAQ